MVDGIFFIKIVQNIIDTGLRFWEIRSTHGNKSKTMRTKTLYLTALLGAVSIATSVAQTVYSVNAVGYVNVTLAANDFTLVANPLEAEINTIAVLFDAAVKGTRIYKFDAAAGGYATAITKNAATGIWNNTTATLLPGEGVFVNNPAPTNVTITFVGQVMQGSLSNNLSAGYQLVSSQVPQADTLDALGFPKAKGDRVYRFEYAGGKGSYKTYTVSAATGLWTGGVIPSVAVGECFFVNKAAAITWARDFSVNQ
jgi:hypothetical protein